MGRGRFGRPRSEAAPSTFLLSPYFSAARMRKSSFALGSYGNACYAGYVSGEAETVPFILSRHRLLVPIIYFHSINKALLSAQVMFFLGCLSQLYYYFIESSLRTADAFPVVPPKNNDVIFRKGRPEMRGTY